MWLKTSAEQGTRRVQTYIYNGTFPFESYNHNVTFEVTSEWKKYDLEFIAKSSNENTAFLQIRCGLDDGDLFLDDVTFTEIDIEGLRTGESLDQKTVQRLAWADQIISENRARDQAQFYLERMEGLFEGDREFIRETIGSDVMLAPSYRIYSALERHAARNYDFFCYPEFRSSTQSYVDENTGANLWIHTAANMESKPYVVDGLNVWFPRPYQTQAGVVVPAYAGLHDWDGINVSYFSSNGQMGNVRSDSNSRWNIYDKPALLAMLPAMSNAFRNSSIKPSPKTLVIQNNQSSIDYPAFHTTTAYSITSSADGRIPWFRRTVMANDIQDEESFMPQLEIPGLSGEIDPSAYNAENEQIFYDATDNVFRVMTPDYMAVVGRLSGKIIAEPDIIVEQLSEGIHTSVTLSSLTENPIVESEKNLLVIGARSLNDGAQYNQAGTDLTIWGQGPMMLEGRSMRVTIKAPEFDSCYVTPLGSDARPMVAQRRSVDRSPTGRFSIVVTTNEDKAPWYIVEFSRVATGVDEDLAKSQLRVSPNPVVNGSLAVRHSELATEIQIVDITGAVVATAKAVGGRTDVHTDHLSAGTYLVLVDGGKLGTTRVVVYE